MQFFSQYGLFLLETVTIVIAILIVVAGVLGLSQKNKKESSITVQSLTEYYQNLKQQLQKSLLDKKTLKKCLKAEAKAQKKHKKDQQLFVIEFDGDLKASSVESLRECVTAILMIADPEKDEVVIKLNSPGGMVNAYGLAASQLQRIRDRNIKLTACIDKVAASGGYLMACIAHQVIAAPFAIIGSIGVVAQLPNFHRWLKKRDIDVELVTAGEFKRTLTVFGENTDEARQKFKDDMTQIHESFKEVVVTHRPQVDLDKVANGDYWLAKDAFQLKLVDKLDTSDDYLMSHVDKANIFMLKKEEKLSLKEKLMRPAAQIFTYFSNKIV